MTGTNKKKDTILDNLKDMLSGEEKETSKTSKASTKAKSTLKKPKAATTKKTTTTTKKSTLSQKTAAGAAAKKAVQEKRDAMKAKKQLEVLHSKTHQDLINAAYKAAETLGIAPWVLLRAAGWGNFTDDRGKKYDGPAIDLIEGLDDAQKKALKDVLGL
jgi:hypothetical protein